MSLTLRALALFVRTRNKSDHRSNMQFMFEANSCGFGVDDLGPATPFTIDGFKGYQWKPQTEAGTVRLVEFGGLLYMGDNDDPATRAMFELMNRAEFVGSGDEVLEHPVAEKQA